MRWNGIFRFSLRSFSILLIIFLSGAIGHFFILEPTEVNGRSMEATLHDEDTIAIEKVSLLFLEPKRGQIVSVFDEHNDILLVKRIVGLPGEQVVIKNGSVFIVDTQGNELALEEPYLSPGTRTLPSSGKEAVYPVIPENSYFVMGDNRTRSTDSRSYGPVHRSNLIGAVRMLFQ